MNTYTYLSRKSETLADIAAKFGCTLSELYRLNSNLPELLSEKTEVLIPGGCNICPAGRGYKLQHGDNIFSVASKFSLTADELLKANPYFIPSRYAVGQTIILPEPRLPKVR